MDARDAKVNMSLLSGISSLNNVFYFCSSSHKMKKKDYLDLNQIREIIFIVIMLGENEHDSFSFVVVFYLLIITRTTSLIISFLFIFIVIRRTDWKLTGKKSEKSSPLAIDLLRIFTKSISFLLSVRGKSEIVLIRFFHWLAIKRRKLFIWSIGSRKNARKLCIDREKIMDENEFNQPIEIEMKSIVVILDDILSFGSHRKKTLTSKSILMKNKIESGSSESISYIIDKFSRC